MKWRNVKLIFTRELRDQLRDRRTLFTVAVMPMILYPLMGMAMLQVGQFMREYPTKVWLVGADNLPSDPALLIDGNVNPDFVSEKEKGLLDIRLSESGDQQFHELIEQFRETSKSENGAELVDQMIQQEMKRRGVDVAVFFPTRVDQKNWPQKNTVTESDPTRGSPQKAAGVYVFTNSASDKSRIGAERFNKLLARWKSAYVSNVLAKHDISLSMVEGVRVTNADVADKKGKRAAVWAKILPFIIMVWALTGAFYPAIDLCAGEKERGTFETLLSSPAARSEIAIGKLLTVMSFSTVTSLLNLLSMGFTGMFVISRLGGTMGLANGMPVVFPPMGGFIWLVLPMLPISALFSAIALAAAAFARSSKEGQYYLIPLMMISMPLMMVPMLPGSQLDLGTSLIPVSGLMLLLRGLIEGQVSECLRYVGPVCIVTLACCWFSVRWVIYQFNCETVLFRASERFNIGNYFKHVIRVRHELPSIGNALLCGLVILVAKFFIGFVATMPESFFQFTRQTVIILVATIGLPAIMMALVLTKNARKSLRLRWCSLPVACAAILAAVFLNPLLTWITALVMQIYPPGGNMMALEQTVATIIGDAPGLWAILLVFAVAPAIIEELAFRGFILSGMESLRNKWQAIILTSILFGVAHGIIQQTMITFVVGVVLGIIAVQTRSLIPCVLFHAVHNSMAVLLSSLKAPIVESSPLLTSVLVSNDGVNYQYGIMPGILMTMVGVAMLVWFIKFPQDPEAEKSSAQTVPAKPSQPVVSG